MTDQVSRRTFFRRLRRADDPVRPPGAVSETELDRGCTRCGHCVVVCPESILISAGGGLPAIDFARGACTFCGRCAAACEPEVIRPVPAWSLRAEIGESCLEPQGITCRLCEDACDASAFRFRPMIGGRAHVIVDTNRCTGCGACVAVCPPGAIRISEPEPERSPCPTS